jgi:hypothetical protein
MSQPDLESVSMPSVITKKPQWNIYSVLMIIALISLLMACLFLLLEIQRYGFGSHKGALSAGLTAPTAAQSIAYYSV